jgi:hypothetical protein
MKGRTRVGRGVSFQKSIPGGLLYRTIASPQIAVEKRILLADRNAVLGRASRPFRPRYWWVEYESYRIDRMQGRLDLRDRELVLSDLSGEMFAVAGAANVRNRLPPENAVADHRLAADFRIEQFESARVVQSAFPNELASVDARIDLHSTLRQSRQRAVRIGRPHEGEFAVDSRQGLVRLTVHKQDMAATAAVFGGTLLLSPNFGHSDA